MSLLFVTLAGHVGRSRWRRSIPALLIFYRGYWWPYCVSELRSFQTELSEFAKRGIRVVAISVDPVETNRMLAEKAGLTFPLLSDPSKKAIGPYDLLHIRGGPKGVDIARPAEFLIDPGGTVRWVNLTDNIRVRARGDELVRAADRELGIHP